MELSIQQILSSDSALTPTSGDVIYSIIQKEIAAKKHVDLDFKGIEIMTSAFLNAAVGRLYSTFSGEELNKLLFIKNISVDDLSILKKVIERAKEYFNDQRTFDERLDQSLD